MLSGTVLDLSDAIVARLEDDRWYVKRNLLVLLDRHGCVPAGFSASPWTSDPDSRVRLEAIRVQLRLPDEYELAILTALEDVDSRVVALGLTAVQDHCPSAAVPRVAELALQTEARDEVRFQAAMALGRVQPGQALVALLKLADGGRSWFGRRKLPPRTPVLLASIRALAAQWASDSRTVQILAAAARSSDPDLRRAAQAATP